MISAILYTAGITTVYVYLTTEFGSQTAFDYLLVFFGTFSFFIAPMATSTGFYANSWDKLFNFVSAGTPTIIWRIFAFLCWGLAVVILLSQCNLKVA